MRVDSMSAPLEMDARQMFKKLTESCPVLTGQTVVDDEEVFKSLVLKMDIKQKYAYTLAWRRSAFELPGDNPYSHIPKTGNLLHECYKEMRKLKQKAIDCYAENYLHENREEHDGDGAFDIQDKDDPHIINMQTRATVQHDLLILGNQLPFFVLQKLTTNCCFCNHEECVIAISNDTTKNGGPGDTNEEGGNGNTKGGGSPSGTKEGGGNGDPIKEGSTGDETEEGGPADDTKEDLEERYYHILHVIHDQYLRFDPPKERGIMQAPKEPIKGDSMTFHS
ncbi:hypothetical protein Vadar_002333 [Vaccinium darrowii]|uniref:Uncharacterized protein n=1 Tax=Vaccinium darrowii TaxID=229202 RepID=A0ACB7ZHZ9_9ERIC|nr:hypothetical protein Vadar_002333 [Vaccinium darrowii]